MGRFSAGNPADPARLERILHAKQRLIGVDVEALNSQVEETKQRKAADQELEQHYAEQITAHVGMLNTSQLNAASIRKDWEREVQGFRATCQGKPTTREWDLNRPDAKKQDLPARLGDDDPRCGPSSLQKFDGEDLTISKRTSAQMQQCKAWWDEQLVAKAQQKQQELEEKQQLAAIVKHLDSLQCSMVGQENAAHAELERQMAVANAELRQMQLVRKNEERQAELQAKLAELAAAQVDPWLNEDPSQAASVLSPARVRKDHWKGMSQAQREAILAEQLAQIEARRTAAAAAAAEEAESAAYQHNVHKAVMRQAQSANEFKRKQAAAAAAVLKEQIAAKVARDAEINEVYANKVTDDYFQQFGTSHR